MDKTVTVSAIMPTYNGARFIGAAIDSILAQTWRDWELIVVDDGSTDETLQVLARYDDPRIKIYHQPQNQGRGLARNIALSHASGKYIAVCDSDDIALPTRLAKQVAFLDRHPETHVVSAQVLYFWGEEAPRPRILYPETNEAIQRRFARGRMAISHAAAMIRAECFERFGGYCVECRRAQDVEFFLRIRRDSGFYSLPEFLVLYRHEVKGIAYRKWMEMTRYGHYAVYRSRAQRSGPPDAVLSYEQFARQWETKFHVYTWGNLRFLKYCLRSFVPVRQVLR